MHETQRNTFYIEQEGKSPLLLFFKREAALWNPVVFIFYFFFLICNGHCCQTQAKKCQFKGKVTFRSIRF